MVTLPKLIALASLGLDFGGGAFPQPIALAATWDPDLVRAVAAATARWAGAQGARLVVVPLSVGRDPRLGRVERTFGEDPHLVAEMGVAALTGLQGEAAAGASVIAAAGGFAGPPSPAERTDVAAAPIAERELRDFYFPPFEAAVARAGVRAIVAARNELDGVPSHANAWLLKDVLRGEWRFGGVVLADAGGMDDLRATYRVAADRQRATALASGAGIEGELGYAAMRAPARAETDRAAQQAAERAIVLLDNRGALPFDLPAAGRPGLKIALADLAGSGLREAIRTRARGRAEVIVLGGSRAADLAAAERADRVVVVAGDDLAAAEALLEALKGASKPVVVLAGARPAASPAIAERAGALLGAWALGASGADAVARVLVGEVNPGGKLPVTLARNPGQWPISYDAKPSGRRGYLFDTTEPLFPFGRGLGYSAFEVGNPRLSKPSIAASESVEVSVDVRNAGERPGDETVQVYVRDKVSSVTRPEKALKAFRRVTLAPGETRTLAFRLEPAAFAMWDERMRRVVEPGEFEILVGPDSSRLKPATLTITGGGG